MSNRISIIRGTSESITVTLVDGSGLAFTPDRLAGATALLQVKAVPTDVSDVIAFTTAANPTQLSIGTQTSTVQITFNPSDTSSLAVQIYQYQLTVSLTDGTTLPAIPWTPFDVNLGGDTVPTPPVFTNTVKIDQDFRLPNDMTYQTPGGSPIENAQIRVYLKSDYDAGKLDAPIGVTMTNCKGGWMTPIFVNPGFTYVARFEKPNEWGPDKKEFFA